MSLRTQKRRRREAKTDYQARMAFLKSSVPRIVVRRTNRYFIAQIVESKEAQDKITLGVTSKDLLEYGWSEKFAGSLKSISAGYLTGYLLAKKAKKGEFIIDLGMTKKHNGGRTYSVIAGLIDGGLNIRANEKVFPSKERLMGEHLKPEMKDIIAKVKLNLEKAK
jgi:large subunit ribosomal protein L18